MINLKSILNEASNNWVTIPIKKICTEMDNAKGDVKKRQSIMDSYFKSYIGADVQFKLDGNSVSTIRLVAVRPYFSNNSSLDSWNTLLGLPYVIGFIFDSKSSKGDIIVYSKNTLELL